MPKVIKQEGQSVSGVSIKVRVECDGKVISYRHLVHLNQWRYCSNIRGLLDETWDDIGFEIKDPTLDLVRSTLHKQMGKKLA